MCQKALDAFAPYGDPFGMHRMLTNFSRFYRLKSAGTHVQSNLIALNSLLVECLQDPFSKMQTCRRSGNRSLDLGIDRLVGTQVALLRFSIEIGRNGKFADGIKHFREGYGIVSPVEDYLMARTANPNAFSSKDYCAVAHDNLAFQTTFLPFLQITDQTGPGTATGLGERQLIISRRVRFETEHLNQRTCCLVKMKARLNHLGIIENHQFPLGQVFGKMGEDVLADLSPTIKQEFRTVSLRKGIFGNAFIGQGIVIIFYPDMLCINHLLYIYLKL
ncbi:hypothetical protein EVA_05409 [gut metagenome]|uniref:Uncharacterized protein n=1 Tax=gut metagenome TaxID=749906 RepID=J9GUJ9_9ZZZZ